MSTPHPSPAGRRSRRANPGVAALTALLEPGLDRSALERMLVACAVHPRVTGFWRAHLLAWNRDREGFDGRLSWIGPDRPLPLEESLSVARRHASEGSDRDATRLLRALRLTPEELGDRPSEVWARGQSAVLVPERKGALPWDGAAAIGVVALRAGLRGYGLLIGEWNDAAEAGTRAADLEALRRAANTALGAHAASEQVRRAGEHAAALAEFARAGVSSLNLAEAVHLLTRLACEGTGARGATLWRMAAAADAEGETLELMSSHGPAGSRDRLARTLQPLAQACVEDGRPIVVDRAADEPLLPTEVAAEISAVVALPVSAYGRVLGTLAVYDRVGGHPSDTAAFEPEDLRFLTAMADQCALAFHHTRSEDARRQGEQARRDLLQQLGRSERLATLGEMSVRLAHEARNPLASIAAFARRVHRSLGEDDPNREYLEVVVREADRLEHAIAGQLQMNALESPRLKMESVNALLQTSLQRVGEQLVRRRVRLLKKLTPDLPPLLLDAERVSSAFQNVLAHALERVSAGGRIRVESRRVQQFVVVEIANDGRSQPGEMMDEMFVPFQLTGGPETGLAMARQIVLQHGGEVRTRSEGEWSSVFLLTLPIRGNEDRRRPHSDRRVTRNDRRQRSPAA
jgi:signal transduction histidine kinase